MIDYKQKYNELYIMLIITVVSVVLIGFYIGIKIGQIKRKSNEKDEKIWQQEIEINELKEQIDRERKEKWKILNSFIMINYMRIKS